MGMKDRHVCFLQVGKKLDFFKKVDCFLRKKIHRCVTTKLQIIGRQTFQNTLQTLKQSFKCFMNVI